MGAEGPGAGVGGGADGDGSDAGNEDGIGGDQDDATPFSDFMAAGTFGGVVVESFFFFFAITPPPTLLPPSLYLERTGGQLQHQGLGHPRRVCDSPSLWIQRRHRCSPCRRN